MISRGNELLSISSLGSTLISEIYKGARLIWQSVRSCFGAGFWKASAPWSNNEGWKN